jgi:hypothetical protein
LESGIIVRGIPERAVPWEVGLIWGIPDKITQQKIIKKNLLVFC